jgi:phosphoglycerate dehydrogenase-like enzyme
MSKRILITPRSLTQHHSPDLQALENAGYELVYVRPGITPTEEELLELVPDCVGWLAGVEPISERVLRAATNLKVISRNGTGVDNIPLKVAQELRIKVLRVEAANARGVAEPAICLALAALRHRPALHCALKQGKWKLIITAHDHENSPPAFHGITRRPACFAGRFCLFILVRASGVRGNGLQSLFPDRSLRLSC